MAAGVKVKIIGPVTVRCGQIMLEPKHIEIMGGQVDDLGISNHIENILARSLGKPENPSPGVVTTEPRDTTTTNNQNHALSTNVNQRQVNVADSTTTNHNVSFMIYIFI